MKLSIYSFGKSRSWIADGVDQYLRRMPQVSVESISDRPVKDKEERMYSRISRGELVVVLDEKGESFTTRELAAKYKSWQMSGSNVSFLIGDADGFSNAIRERADLVWSLSALTFPHALVRVIVCEQLYRVRSLVNGHPYHRG